MGRSDATFSVEEETAWHPSCWGHFAWLKRGGARLKIRFRNSACIKTRDVLRTHTCFRTTNVFKTRGRSTLPAPCGRPGRPLGRLRAARSMRRSGP
eukprot:6190235-Pleurochrysis_carterae.AAC.1